jgi:hypothetical protein
MTELTRKDFIRWGREGGLAGRKTPRRAGNPGRNEETMKIERNMDVNELCQRMGSDATEAEAKRMRDLLVTRYDDEDTDDVDDGEWLEMLQEVAQ